MKKSTLAKIILALVSILSLVLCTVWLLRRYSDRIPFLSRFTDDELEPEEDLFEEAFSNDSLSFIEEQDAAGLKPEHEEKRQARIRRGYIPLRLRTSEE